jgi:hypothetical protein
MILVKNISDAKTHFFGQRFETDYKPIALKENIKSQYNGNTIQQRFSTWGTRTPRGTCAVCRGYAKF